jgi:hypothetical protein
VEGPCPPSLSSPLYPPVVSAGAIHCRVQRHTTLNREGYATLQEEVKYKKEMKYIL